MDRVTVYLYVKLNMCVYANMNKSRSSKTYSTVIKLY